MKSLELWPWKRSLFLAVLSVPSFEITRATKLLKLFGNLLVVIPFDLIPSEGDTTSVRASSSLKVHLLGLSSPQIRIRRAILELSLRNVLWQILRTISRPTVVSQLARKGPL